MIFVSSQVNICVQCCMFKVTYMWITSKYDISSLQKHVLERWSDSTEDEWIQGICLFLTSAVDILESVNVKYLFECA